jgi:hypothetical protein
MKQRRRIYYSAVQRIKRTLDGAEIDEIIADVQARAIEHWRRTDWRTLRMLPASAIRDMRAESTQCIACLITSIVPSNSCTNIVTRGWPHAESQANILGHFASSRRAGPWTQSQ